MNNEWQYHLVKGISWLVCRLPYKLILLIGASLGPVYGFIAKKQKLRGIKNIKIGMNMNDQDAEQLIEKLFKNLGRSVMEVLYMPNLTKSFIDKHIEIGVYHVVRFEELELRLRRQFCKIFDCKSVTLYIDAEIKNKQQLLNFGRGKNIVWPLAAIVALKEKQAELDPESTKNKKENNNTQKESEEVTHDMVNKPKHYMFNVDGNDVQAIDLVKGLLTPEEFRGWIKGSYFTYLMRADKKNGIEDLEKARTFLNWQIQLDKGEELTLPGKK